MMEPGLSYELRVLDLIDIRPAPVPPPATFAEKIRRLLRFAFWHHGPFVVTIVLPVVAAAFYLFALSQDRYLSEARFIVRTPSVGTTSIVGSLIAGTSVTRAVDDAYIINSFIESRSGLAAIGQKHDIRKMFAKGRGDPLWRFPGPFRSDGEEELYRYYRRLVTLSYDKNSGLTSLYVQAFSPQDAQAIATALLEGAEVLANRLSARARDDSLRYAEADVQDARARATQPLEKLTEYRNRERVVDPTRISNSIVETIGRLSLEIAVTNAELMDLRRSAALNPRVQTLQTRIQALERQVQNERNRLAGSDMALAAKIAEFELLALEKDFAEKRLSAAIKSAEAARLDVIRQQLYVERVVEPNLSDYPEAPRRLLMLGVVLFACFLLYSSYKQLRRAQLERKRLG